MKNCSILRNFLFCPPISQCSYVKLCSLCVKQLLSTCRTKCVLLIHSWAGFLLCQWSCTKVYDNIRTCILVSLGLFEIEMQVHCKTWVATHSEIKLGPVYGFPGIFLLFFCPCFYPRKIFQLILRSSGLP